MTAEQDLKAEFRVITEYSTDIMSDADLDAVMSRAKKHIRAKKGLQAGIDWYGDVHREEALFWFTCLFAKVATGELDAQDVQVAAIDVKNLLAKDDNDVTTWYRNAMSALHALEPAATTGISAPERENRVYGGDDDTGPTLN